MNDNILCGNLDHNSPLILTGNSEKLKETVHTQFAVPKIHKKSAEITICWDTFLKIIASIQKISIYRKKYQSPKIICTILKYHGLYESKFERIHIRESSYIYE